jgi:uncharacterized phage protein (TIGR01671 family)
MTRQIKFRGKRTDNSEWVYGYYVAADEKHYIFTGEKGLSQVTPVHKLLYKDFVRYEVIPETVGRFTGLHDKNSREIYNGDILKATSRYNGKEYLSFVVDNVRGYCYDVVYINPTSGEKRWSLYGWVVSDKNDHDIEIIGNVHDNPDLLTTK